MAETTPTNVGRNNVLLFGDYGTEIMRLTQLYDPKQDRYQKSTDPRPIAGEKYFTITLRNRTIYFNEVEDITAYTKDGTAIGEFRNDVTLWKDTGKECQNGYYVPVTQTMVVVDKATEKWGTYTLLIVDAVDPETYESTLVPVNFTGGVDTAIRAIDWNNNLLNLFVDKITLGNEDGRVVYKLTPDRKILAYGAGDIRYLIKKKINGIETIICTDSTTNAKQDSEEFIPFDSAAAFVDYRNAQVTNMETFEALNGQTIQYYDPLGIKHQIALNIERNPDGSYTDETAALYQDLLKVYLRGETIKVFSDSEDAVARVQLPEPCYLRSSIGALVPGEEVTLEVYEAVPDMQIFRLITGYRVVVRDAVPLDPADLSKAQITGFDVKLYGHDVADIWEIAQGTSLESLELTPYLQLDNGDQVNISTLKNLAYFQYGLEQIPKSVKGAEFDILFKYFPQKAIGVRNSTTLDTRYVEKTESVPSPLKQYFVKTADNVWDLAENNGHPTSFQSGVTYYVRAQKLSWQTVINRPDRDFIVCKKRVRIVSATGNEIRKICVIPLWDNDHERWDLKYLVYKSDYLAPKLIDYENSDYGSIYIPGGEPDLTVSNVYNNVVRRFKLYFRPNGSTSYLRESETDVSLLMQHFTSDLVGMEKWLIGGKEVDMMSPDAHVYGRNTGDIHRPFILCKTPTPENNTMQYRIPMDPETGFPLISQEGGLRNTFIEYFFDRALTDEDVTDNWASDLVKPTHFRIRATDNVDEHATEWIEINEHSAEIEDPDAEEQEASGGYGKPIVVDGLELPDPTVLGIMGIVIVEFAVILNGRTKVLMGVPVEVRPDQA